MITTIITIMTPLFQWFIKSLITRFELNDEQKKRLVEIDELLDQIDSGEIKRGKALEKELPSMDKEMQEIIDGKKKWPSERVEDEKTNK